MSCYTPVEFIAPNVEVEILYDAKWTNCIIKTVKKRDVLGNGAKYVFCEVQMLNKTHDVVNETLHESDYECEFSDFAWRFSDTFKPLVDQLLKVQEIRDQEKLDEETDDPKYEPSDDSDEDEDDDDVSDPDETDDESDIEDDVVYVKHSPSLTNTVFATLFMLSPWFASLAVVYNARNDIFEFLKKKYC